MILIRIVGKMYHLKKAMRTAEARGKLAYIHMVVVFSSLVQRNLCIEIIILIETLTFTTVCLTHVCDTEGLCVSVSLVYEVIFGSSGVVISYSIPFVVFVFVFRLSFDNFS